MKKLITARNFVAKHMQKCGQGTHVDKKGKLAPLFAGKFCKVGSGE